MRNYVARASIVLTSDDARKMMQMTSQPVTPGEVVSDDMPVIDISGSPKPSLEALMSKRTILAREAAYREIHLYLMPAGHPRRERNSSYARGSREGREIFWHVEIVFSMHKNEKRVHLDACSEEMTVSHLVKNARNALFEKLRPGCVRNSKNSWETYRTASIDNLDVFLLKEHVVDLSSVDGVEHLPVPNCPVGDDDRCKFAVVEKNEVLESVLNKRVVIEFPIFYVAVSCTYDARCLSSACLSIFERAEYDTCSSNDPASLDTARCSELGADSQLQETVQEDPTMGSPSKPIQGLGESSGSIQVLAISEDSSMSRAQEDDQFSARPEPETVRSEEPWQAQDQEKIREGDVVAVPSNTSDDHEEARSSCEKSCPAGDSFILSCGSEPEALARSQSGRGDRKEDTRLGSKPSGGKQGRSGRKSRFRDALTRSYLGDDSEPTAGDLELEVETPQKRKDLLLSAETSGDENDSENIEIKRPHKRSRLSDSGRRNRLRNNDRPTLSHSARLGGNAYGSSSRFVSGSTRNKSIDLESVAQGLKHSDEALSSRSRGKSNELESLGRPVAIFDEDDDILPPIPRVRMPQASANVLLG